MQLALNMDLTHFKLTVSGTRNITVPDIVVEFEITDSQTQKTIHQNARAGVNFWTYLGGLTNAEKRDFAEASVQWLINKRIRELGGG